MNNIESMIESLSSDLKPVKPLHHPALRAMIWASVVVAYVTLVLLWLGVRNDVSERLGDSQFLYEIASVAMIGFSAACASVWMCIPDIRGNGWIIAVPTALCVNFLLWMLTIGAEDIYQMDHAHFSDCCEKGFFLAGIPTFLIVIMSMRGSTTRPYAMAAMNTMAGASVASIGLRFSCGIDSMDHAILYHVLPFVAAGFVIGIFARKIYKW